MVWYVRRTEGKGHWSVITLVPFIVVKRALLIFIVKNIQKYKMSLISDQLVDF